MRGSRTPRKLIITTGGTPNLVVPSDLNKSQRSVWVVNDDGQPKSPLSIERLSRNVHRNISRVARVKPRCKPMARKRTTMPEESFPFFIDKTPSEELTDVIPSRRRSLMNESVIVLDSPNVRTATSESSSERPAQEPSRQNSVDTVDLCSEEEEERVVTKGTKRRKKREGIPGKRRKMCIKTQDHQPDIIVLDEEEESVGRSNGNSSIIVESVQVTASQNSDNAVTTSSVSGINKRSARTTIKSSGLSMGRDFRSKYLDKPLGIAATHNKDIVLPGKSNPGSTGNLYADGNSRGLPDTVGSNVFNPCQNVQQTGLRPVIIDGCNVAIAHGGNRAFSVKGLCICVEYFLRRGHCEVVALVPLHLRSKVSPQDRDVLESLKNDGHLVFTPSRFIDNRLISSYDDRFIVQYAAAVGGVIVSRDNYRDLLPENPAWRDTITNRLLMPTWVGDFLMFPVDPLGKSGPSLDDFLQFPSK